MKQKRDWIAYKLLQICNYVALLISVGCGYQWGEERFKVAVPYVLGDSDGSLTQEIVRHLAISGKAQVAQWGADYVLQVAIGGAEREMIGYRRDQQQIHGTVKKNLLASEGRKTVRVEAALYKMDSKNPIKGPLQIDADADFDYVDGDSVQDLTFVDPQGMSQVVLPFSLGQLESSDAAEEAAMRPLQVRLAKKIIEAIFHD